MTTDGMQHLAERRTHYTRPAIILKRTPPPPDVVHPNPEIANELPAATTSQSGWRACLGSAPRLLCNTDQNQRDRQEPASRGQFPARAASPPAPWESRLASSPCACPSRGGKMDTLHLIHTHPGSQPPFPHSEITHLT